MSTKSTIAEGPTFCLYHELADEEDVVYLALDSVHYQAAYNQVVVPIPVHIWETIRAYPGVDLSWAHRSDDELRAEVTRRVDDRLAYVAAALPENKGLARLMGSLSYGEGDAPREEQIAEGIRHFELLRAHQQEIVAAIAELRGLNRSPAPRDAPTPPDPQDAPDPGDPRDAQSPGFPDTR